MSFQIDSFIHKFEMPLLAVYLGVHCEQLLILKQQDTLWCWNSADIFLLSI